MGHRVAGYLRCWRSSGGRHLSLFDQRDGFFRFIKELSLAWRFLATGALEAVLLQALVPQAKPVFFLVQYFEFVAAAVDEHKQHGLERI